MVFDQKVIVPADQDEMLHMVPAKQNEASSVIYLYGFLHRKARFFSLPSNSHGGCVHLFEDPGKNENQNEDCPDCYQKLYQGSAVKIQHQNGYLLLFLPSLSEVILPLPGGSLANLLLPNHFNGLEIFCAVFACKMQKLPPFNPKKMAVLHQCDAFSSGR